MACFLLLSGALVLVVYWKALGAPFVYDDLDQVVANPWLVSWRAAFARFGLRPVQFTNDLLGAAAPGSTYRPVYWLTLALDRRLWGVNGAGGFHLTNLLLHWANGALCFLLQRRLRVRTGIAFASALLWLLLPIHAEAVAWVSGRAYPLSTMFLLLGLLYAERFLRNRRPAALAGYVVCAVAALFSHEQGLLLVPFTVVLAAWKRNEHRREATRLAAAALLVGVAASGVRLAVGAHGAGGASAVWPAAAVFWRYLGWILAPVHMSVERSTSLPRPGLGLNSVALWAALVAAVGGAVLLRRRVPLVSAGLAWTLLCLLPYCGLVPVYQGMAERFTYLAAMGVCLAGVAAAMAVARPWREMSIGVVILWALWGVGRLVHRVADWTDPVQLYRSSLRATPRSASLAYNLGYSLQQAGDVGGAREAYLRTLSLRPEYPQALASLGDLDAAGGQYREAVAAYERALRVRPDDGKVLLNEGVAFQRLGDRLSAEGRFRRVIALVPHDSAAYVDLGGLLVEQGRVAEGVRSFEQAMQADPGDPDAYFNLAVVYQRAGRDELALPLYKRVLALKPNDPNTLNNMSALHVPDRGRSVR